MAQCSSDLRNARGQPAGLLVGATSPTADAAFHSTVTH